ncbi:MAG: CARDB domain-containing protein [Candidatus Altiarchaeia archaeon]
MRKKETIIIIFLILLATLCTANDAQAEAVEKITGVFCKFICLAEMTVGAIAALMIMLAGLRYVTAGDDAGVRRRVWGWIINAFVGVAIVAIAVYIVNYVASEISAPLNCNCEGDAYIKQITQSDRQTENQQPPGLQAKKADLLIIDADAPGTSTGGASFSVTVKNSGYADACTLEAALYLDNEKMCDASDASCLAPGKAKELTCSAGDANKLKEIAAKSPTHTLKAVADPLNKIDESSEGNNIFQKGISLDRTQEPACKSGEYELSYDQESADGCDNVLDGKCAGKNDDPSDKACCKSKFYCVNMGECAMTFTTKDVNGDGVAGEWCSQNSQWVDCDSDRMHCESNCRMKWSRGGEDAPFGEYNAGTGEECCGDDPDELYVTSGPGAPRCCKTGNTYVDASGRCLKQQPRITLLFLPVDYGATLTKASFDAARDRFLNKLLDNLPLKACPDLVQVNTVYADCGVGISAVHSVCDQKSMEYLRFIKACADASSQSYNYIIGLEANEVCADAENDTEGFTNYNMKTIMIEATGDPNILTHELGHSAAGLNDEYYDAVRCGICVITPTGNKLDKNYKGSDPAGLKNDPTYCADGSKCTDDAQITCMGNNPKTISGTDMKASDGTYSRCMMSYAGLADPRTFCKQCVDQMKKVPELNCGP